MPNVKTCTTRECPVTPELARNRRDAMTALLMALKASITVTRLVVRADNDALVRCTTEDLTPEAYATMTDLYSAGRDGVEHATARYSLVDGLVQLPSCVIVKTTEAREGSATLDTAVYQVETGVYDRSDVDARLADLERADWAIEEATAKSMSDRGVTIRRYLVDETDAEAVRHIDQGEISAQDYATRARLCDAMSTLCCGVYRVWEPTCAGWLVTNEQSDPTGKVYAYDISLGDMETVR